MSIQRVRTLALALIAISASGCGAESTTPVGPDEYVASEDVLDAEGRVIVNLSAEFDSETPAGEASRWLSSLEPMRRGLFIDGALDGLPSAAFPDTIEAHAYDDPFDLDAYVVIDHAASGVDCIDTLVRVEDVSRRVSASVAPLRHSLDDVEGDRPSITAPRTLSTDAPRGERTLELAVLPGKDGATRSCELEVEVTEWNAVHAHTVDLPSVEAGTQIDVAIDFRFRESCVAGRNELRASLYCGGELAHRYTYAMAAPVAYQ